MHRGAHGAHLTPRITIETTTATLGPTPDEELTLADLLAIRRLPANLFQAYALSDAAEPRPIPIDTRLDELAGAREVILRCIRNPDLAELIETIVTRHTVPNAVATLEDLNFGREGCERIVYELDDQAARSIVQEKVDGFVCRHSRADPLIVGVSGGGDSNALIGAMQHALSREERGMLAYTLVCDPVWPEASAARAAALCEQHGVQHLIIDDADMRQLLGMKGSVSEFYDAFLERYGTETSHFAATYLISAAGRRLARGHGVAEYCLGYNREDVLAEVLFSILNGRTPLAFPVRRFGDIRLLMPVWEVPKLVLDACYPEFSKSNYEERIATTPQRGLIYFLAHAIEGAYSNLGHSLMDGLRRIFDGQWPDFKVDAAFDVYAEEFVPEAQLDDARAFLAEHFEPRAVR